MSLRNKHRALQLIALLSIIILIGWNSFALAQKDVMGKILKKSANSLDINIIFNKNHPQSGILVLFLPNGLEIEKATPPLSNISSDKTEAKWLIKKIDSKSLKISIEFKEKIPKTEKIKASFRFKDPSNGKVKEITIEQEK